MKTKRTKTDRTPNQTSAARHLYVKMLRNVETDTKRASERMAALIKQLSK